MRQFTPNWQGIYGQNENSLLLAQLLVLAFPTAQIVKTSEGYFLTRLDDRCYDIYGIQPTPDWVVLV